jgi:DNA primase small subunit
MYDQVQSNESEFLKKLFGAYYEKNFISSVPDPSFREFGFGVFKRKIANRNMYFASTEEMNLFLRQSKPLFFSYSNAYYKHPERTPMTAKELLKADIIYEFDADELGLEVEEINGIQWFMSEHLEEAKKQVFRLLNFVENDFGFSMDGVAINFSGKAGYHVHLRSKSIQDLNKRARIELVDYLTAHNMDLVNLGYDFEKTPFSCPVNKGRWGARLNNGIKEFFNKDAKSISKITEVPAKKVSLFLGEKPKLFDSMDKGTLLQLEGKKSKMFWTKVLEYVISKEMVPIDRQTSIDLHKIIRVPQTLHGDTGLVAKTISIDELKTFDPFKDSVVFNQTFAKQFGVELVKLHIIKTPKFSIFGETFGPFENKDEELPLFAAAYLIGKGAATIRV